MEPRAERIREIVEHQSMERRSLRGAQDSTPIPAPRFRMLSDREREEIHEAIRRFAAENPGKLVNLREVSR